MWNQAARRVAGALFGGTCFLCRGRADAVLCEDCRAELPHLDAARCPCCARPAPLAQRCGRCLAAPPHYDATHAALVYRFPADVLIRALKFRAELALAPLLGALLAARVAGGERVDRVLAVPLAPRRLRARGYNQAIEIARVIAREAGARLDAGVCERVRDTPAQAELPWSERVANMRGAFRCTGGLEGCTVAVVDDVMTSGATLDALAQALKHAGAARVVNWVVARTDPPGDA